MTATTSLQVQRKQKLLLRNVRYKYCIDSYIVQMAQ